MIQVVHYRRYYSLLIIVFLTLSWKAQAQKEFMLYGTVKIEGESTIGTKIIIHPFEERPETQKVDDPSGQFKVFLKYGKDYVITLQHEGFVKLLFKVSTKLPSSLPQCCQSPVDISCHLFKPGGKYDSLFLKPFITIKYDTKLKGYNSSLDVDYYIKKLFERTEQERIARAKEAQRRKRIADSMAIEKKYLEHITKGNLYFGSKQYDLAHKEYEEAHKVIPARQYPLYKMEDVKTEVARFFHGSDSIAKLNVDSIWKSRQPDTSKPKQVYKRLTAEEVHAKMIRDVQNNMKKQGATDQAIKESFDYLDKAVTQVRLAKGDSTPHRKIEPILEPSRLDTARTIAMPVPTLILPEEPAQQESIKQEESPFAPKQSEMHSVAEKKTAIYNEKKYQDSLLQKYPTIRTVEVQKDDYKTVTRVIINKNNHVDVFAKVEHKWGATFYFIENGPQQYENISESFFKVSTMETESPSTNSDSTQTNFNTQPSEQ